MFLYLCFYLLFYWFLQYCVLLLLVKIFNGFIIFLFYLMVCFSIMGLLCFYIYVSIYCFIGLFVLLVSSILCSIIIV